MSSRPWFNLARQQPQPLQQFSAVARISLYVRAPDPSPTPSPITLHSLLKNTTASVACGTLGRRCGPAGAADGAEAMALGLGSGSDTTEPRRVRVRLAHAELASCADGPAWDGGTCLALSGGRSGCAEGLADSDRISGTCALKEMVSWLPAGAALLPVHKDMCA